MGTFGSIEGVDPEELQLRLNKIDIGNQLDILCTSGNKGGTSFLPVQADTDSDVPKLLGTTVYTIPSGTDRETRRNELRNPRAIPVLQYHPNSQAHFWERVDTYRDDHRNDTAPGIYGMVETPHIKSFAETQKKKFDENPTLTTLQQANVPMYAITKGKEEIPETVARIADRTVQGIIVEGKNLIYPLLEEWHEHVSSRQIVPIRPFIGLRGTSGELRKFMSADSSPEEVDTLVFTDVPTLDDARYIHAAHLERMKSNKNPEIIHNPFNNDSKKESVRIGVINVQGAARMDAKAIIEASEFGDLNVHISLIENTDQLRDIDTVVLPGGWHRIQYGLQEELGMKPVLVEYLKTGKHLLALCAGSIQARASDNDMDAIQSIGCAVGTTFGIGNYKVVNNTLKGPYDMHVKVHKDKTSDSPSRLLHQVPFSNGPYFIGEDLESKMSILARLKSEPHAQDIDEDDGPIVALQTRQIAKTDPVRMVAGFHDKFIILLFLNELELFKMAARHEKERLIKRRQCHLAELDLKG